MISWLTRLAGVAARRCLGDLVAFLAVAFAVTLCVSISLGFAIVGAYLHLAESLGDMIAALVLAAAFAALAITIVAIRAAINGVRRSRQPLPPQSPESADPLVQLMAAISGPEAQKAAAAAIQMGRDLPPIQLLAAALIGGFLAGRRLRK